MFWDRETTNLFAPRTISLTLTVCVGFTYLGHGCLVVPLIQYVLFHAFLLIYIMKIKYLFLFLLVFLTSCSVCRISTKTNVETIHFGSGGGFTGAVTTYILKSDGKLLKDDVLLKNIPCDSVLSVFRLAEQINVKQYHPDNIYNFIYIKTKTVEHYYVWSWGDQLDGQLAELDRELLKILK